MPASYAVQYGDMQDKNFADDLYVAPSQSWPAGIAVVFVWDDLNRTIAAPQIGTTALASVGTPASGGHIFWGVIGAQSASFSCTGSGVAFGIVGSVGGVVTGGDTSGPTAVDIQALAFTGPDPLAKATVIVPTNGVGIGYIGAELQTGTPATWTVVTRDAASEAVVATGNTGNIASGHTSTSGSITPSVSGASGNGWGFASGAQAAIAFAAGTSAHRVLLTVT